MKCSVKFYASIILLFFIFEAGNLFAITIKPVTNSKVIKLIENKGQWDAQILFKASIPNGNLYVTKTGIAYGMFDEKVLHDITHDKKEGVLNMHNLKVDFVGCNANPMVVKQTRSFEYYNYFIGNNKSKWANHCYAYEKITLLNLYRNIDLEIIALEGSYKTNFVVHAGGNPANIQLSYVGPNSMEINNGALNVYTSVGIMKEEKPVCYQNNNSIGAHFILNGNMLSYSINSFDQNSDLTIDPTVVFSSFSGSTADNWGFTATYDNAGCAYGGGTVYSYLGGSYPVTFGAFQTTYKGGVTIPNSEEIARDIGIMKLSPDGTQLLYATLLGGANNEQPHSMVCDSSGNLIIMGTTSSTDFPTTTGAFDRTQNGLYDIIVSKLSSDGSTMVGSTYFGGTKDDGLNNDATHGLYDATDRPLTYNYGDQFRGEVVIDENQNIVVASTTHSSVSDGFPIQNGFQISYGGGNQDACLIKFNPTLTNLYFSTYIGGSLSDAAYGIAFDNLGYIYVCGGTNSANIAHTGGAAFNYHGSADGFIAKVSPSGGSSLGFIYVGTTLYDQSYFIQIDKQQNVYITGQSNGAFPVSSGVYSNAGGNQFIEILDRNLTTVKASTVFGTGGGVPNISPSAFLVDVCGRVYVSGWGGVVNASHNWGTGYTTGLPITANAVQSTTDGSDFYLIVFAKDLKALSYATFYGGSISNEHVDGGTSRFDKNGVVYQSVCGGCGGHSDFPTSNGAWSKINRSSNCNNAVFKIYLNVSEYAPEFRDTLIHVTATDMLFFPFQMIDKDGDSIYYTVTGNIFSLAGNAAGVSKTIGAGVSKGILIWQTMCKDVSKDTIFLTVNMIDNGCPVTRTGTGTIKILVNPIPPLHSPFPQCLTHINDSALKLSWGNILYSKYYKSYKIYRKVNNGDFAPLTTINNYTTNLFIDTTAFNDVINNYCYFISSVNVCDSVTDSSRVVCSLYKTDTAVNQVFSFTKDTIIKVSAFDTLSYTAQMSSIDPKDSIFLQTTGSVFGNPKLIYYSSSTNLSKGTISFKWTTSCDDIHSTDTPYIKFYMKDNQCPTPNSNSGTIKIVVVPPPLNAPPLIECVKFIDNNTVEIKWPQSVANKYFRKYTLIKKLPNGTFQNMLNVTNTNAFSIQDAAAINNLKLNYCYAIAAQDVCGYYGDTSLFKCTIRQPSDYPPSMLLQTVTVLNNSSVAMFWNKSSEQHFLSYDIYKKQLLSTEGYYQKVNESISISDTFFIDKNVKVQDSSYCYKLTQTNECGLESENSYEACSILLRGISNPFEHYLKWNGYNYWNLGVSKYSIVRIQPQMQAEIMGTNPDKDTLFKDDQLNYENGFYSYFVVADESTKGFGNKSQSNQIDLIQAPLVHVPDAYTPNNDSLNDSWNVVPVFVKDFHLKIYNRWGMIVYESFNKHELFKGFTNDLKIANNDVFVYIIDYTGWDQNSHQAKGNLTILR
ncbi:MAG: gliding motility-associated C-terminal domain-containing protein [Bacteroidota bacterium]